MEYNADFMLWSVKIIEKIIGIYIIDAPVMCDSRGR